MDRRAIIVTDLGYGDAGKGTMVDYLVRQARSSVVVRHNGGSQAGHNVVTPDGRHHTFSQFGSGSFVPGSQTHLSRFMMVNPEQMLAEALHLQNLGITDIWRKTSIDEDAMVVTPWHVAVNRLRETVRGRGRHGSCGLGIGEAMADFLQEPSMTLRVRDLMDPDLPVILKRIMRFKLAHAEKLVEQSDRNFYAEALLSRFFKFDAFDRTLYTYRLFTDIATIVPTDYLRYLMRAAELTVFEGAQGVLLDQSFGFHPYTTWSITHHQNALTLLNELAPELPVTRLGVLRSYMTRHGAGPFVTEDDELRATMPETHNVTNTWQQGFRIGYPDLVALRYAVDVCGGVDELAVTHTDRLASVNRVATSYAAWEADPSQFELTEDGAITSIIKGQVGQKIRQAAITHQLMSCTPRYESLEAPASGDETIDASTGFLGLVSRQLGAPVTTISSGPTWKDKRAL